jgi:hypothetical protein
MVSEGHKHCRPGWINTPCPFCSGHEGFHLGFNTDSNYFFCWRCGWHPAWEVVGELLRLPKSKALSIVAEFPARPALRTRPERARERKQVRLPPAAAEWPRIHRDYLKGRGFGVERIVAEWGAVPTTYAAGPYSWRIISPVHFEGQLVSYHSRDVTGRADKPHMACPKDQELRDHKHCLYGYDKVPGRAVVVVEGITDVWRLGPGAVATFGIQYSEVQVRLLRDFEQVIVLYDSGEPEARAQARKLAADLGTLNGKKVELVWLDVEDPALLPQADADSLMRDLLQ